MSKKIVPALYHLFEKEKLPKLIRIIGFSRQDFNDESFRNQILKFLSEHKDIKASSEKLKEFLKLFSYHPGTFENNSDYKSLAEKLGQIDGEWKVCANKLFYLAVPPVHYEVIFRQLAESGLTKPCSEEEGWTRVLVEKPFGKDLATSIRLDEQMAKLFKEEQIYRIDHYLAKEMVQNILSFRFANNLFDESWN
ncbi:glucose-6-phosphate dehydrogenase, partial [Candidatus Collierbacteria bacterium]|nr:glucose-6-phosphate dehydrogenase [Candidatus Collierbacteria bacterium]